MNSLATKSYEELNVQIMPLKSSYNYNNYKIPCIIIGYSKARFVSNIVTNIANSFLYPALCCFHNLSDTFSHDCNMHHLKT